MRRLSPDESLDIIAEMPTVILLCSACAQIQRMMAASPGGGERPVVCDRCGKQGQAVSRVAMSPGYPVLACCPNCFRLDPLRGEADICAACAARLSAERPPVDDPDEIKRLLASLVLL